MDCWDGEREGLGGYVELKTTRVMDNQAQVARFERDKLLKWWAQSFPIGVRRCVYFNLRIILVWAIGLTSCKMLQDRGWVSGR